MGCTHHTPVYAAQTVGLMQGIARFPGGHAHQIPSVSGPALLLLYHTGTQFVKPIFGGYKRVEKSRPCYTQAAEKGGLPMWTDSEYISEPIPVFLRSLVTQNAGNWKRKKPISS